jgi:hypothetical protein
MMDTYAYACVTKSNSIFQTTSTTGKHQEPNSNSVVHHDEHKMEMQVCESDQVSSLMSMDFQSSSLSGLHHPTTSTPKPNFELPSNGISKNKSELLSQPACSFQTASTPNPVNPTNGFGRNSVHKKMECLMCDDVRVVGSTPLDLHKHLVEKHFRDRLLDLIPSIGSSLGGKPRYCCPFQGCFYEHHYKWIIAKHYGIKHRVAKQFYEEVIGIGKVQPRPEVQPVLPAQQTNPPVKNVSKEPQKVTSQDLSTFQSVIALKEQLQAQQQQQQRQLQPWQLSQKVKAYKQPTKYFAAKIQSKVLKQDESPLLQNLQQGEKLPN